MKANYSTVGAEKISEALMRQALQKKDEEIAAKDFAIALLKEMMCECESCKNKIAGIKEQPIIAEQKELDND